MSKGYAYVWEYQVLDTALDRFKSLYGPSGEWVRLFLRAEGYICTELLDDREQPSRFLSIDHWESRKAYEKFRAAFANEYAEIDEMGEGLTVRERYLGSFTPIGHAIDRSDRG